MSDFNEIGVKRVCAMAFIQAFKDWESLCKLLATGRIISEDGIVKRGPAAPIGWHAPQFGFAEIENFVRDNADLWVEMDPDLVMAQLDRMRRRAVSRARLR
jgi:hypothetical protein